MDTPQKIRITEPGFAKYTGPIAYIMFENGVSVEPVLPQQAAHIGAIMRVEAIDDARQVGTSVTLKDHMDSRAPKVTPMARMDEADLKPATPPKSSSSMPKYTREQLETIADTRGVAGIRDIANQYGLKGRSIIELIDAILAKN